MSSSPAQRTVIVSYRVKADAVAENEQLIGDVYTELHQLSPDGLAYSTTRLEDGATFVHVAHFWRDDNPLEQLTAFAHFQAGLGQRCEQPPDVQRGDMVRSYQPQTTPDPVRKPCPAPAPNQIPGSSRPRP